VVHVLQPFNSYGTKGNNQKPSIINNASKIVVRAARASIKVQKSLSRFFMNIPRNVGYAFNRWERNTSIPDPLEFGLSYSEVSFPTEDGLILRGWWFGTSIKSPVIILIHGSGANRAEPPARVFGIIKELFHHGYNILTFDLRAHGESDGQTMSGGYHEKNDLLGAISYIRRRGISAKIGLLGFSLGAAVSLMAAAESKEISAVLADSSFGDIVSIMENEFSKRRYLPKFLIPLIIFTSKVLHGIDFTKVKPLDSIRSILSPVFIIHGGLDETIPVSHAYRLIKACKNRQSQLWIVPEAGHTSAYFERTDEYIKRMLTFFKAAFA
jgi:uncharacterized protein